MGPQRVGDRSVECPSEVVDDVLVDLKDGLKLGVGYDVHGGRLRIAEMNLVAQVALLSQMEAGDVACAWREILPEEGVAVPEVDARKSVFVIRTHFASRGEHVETASIDRLPAKFGWKGLEGICRPST